MRQAVMQAVDSLLVARGSGRLCRPSWCLEFAQTMGITGMLPPPAPLPGVQAGLDGRGWDQSMRGGGRDGGARGRPGSGHVLRPSEPEADPGAWGWGGKSWRRALLRVGTAGGVERLRESTRWRWSCQSGTCRNSVTEG